MLAALPLTLLACLLCPGDRPLAATRQDACRALPQPALCQIAALPAWPAERLPEREPRRPFKKAVLSPQEQDTEEQGRSHSPATAPHGHLPAGPEFAAAGRHGWTTLLRPGEVPTPLHLRLHVLVI